MRANDFGQHGATECFASAGLAEGTNANTFKIAAPNGAGVDYSIDGLMYHKADTDNIAFSAGHSELADLKECVFLVQLDSSGNVTTKQGDQVLSTDIAEGTRALDFPIPDAGKCPIGAIRVKNATGSGWTAGSDDLGEASVTDTYYNFAGRGPARPLGS